MEEKRPKNFQNSFKEEKWERRLVLADINT